MTLEQLEDSLPNGFHDAFIEAIAVDYVSREIVMKMQLHTGNSDAATKEEREAYKPAEVHLLDFLCFAVDTPDPKYKYAERKGLWIDAGKAGATPGPPPCLPAAVLPKGTFAHWFFVRDWNSFIHVAAKDARLKWI